MAGNENQDWTDSPAVRVNEPTETSYSSLRGPEPERSCTDDQSGVAEGMQKMALCDNGEVPGAIGGVLGDENHHNSSMVKEAQQVVLDKFEDKLNRKEPQTSGGTAPNVDEELCEKKCLKIGNIDPTVFIRACNLLNIEQVMGKDWRSLAGRLGYNVTDVQIFKCKENSAESMLNDWDIEKHNYLEHLVKELREMRREDVADLLQKEIDKKGDNCSCPDCGHIM